MTIYRCAWPPNHREDFDTEAEAMDRQRAVFAEHQIRAVIYVMEVE